MHQCEAGLGRKLVIETVARAVESFHKQRVQASARCTPRPRGHGIAIRVDLCSIKQKQKPPTLVARTILGKTLPYHSGQLLTYPERIFSRPRPTFRRLVASDVTNCKGS
jgi:hypothetical protein